VALPTSRRSQSAAPIIPTRRSSPATVRDPKDDHLAALARAADADVLVSIDNDLLQAPIDDLAICRPEIRLDRLARV
jgi:predicted nucleic acid-binding protein